MSSASSGVELVPFERRHLAETLRWTNDPELARLMDRPRRIDEDEHQRWFESLSARTDTVYFAIEEDGRHVGNVWLAALDRRHRKAEVRIVLGPTAVNRGCGTRAIELIADHAFISIGLNRVYAFVLAFNPRARRAFEKAQFVLEGTLREDRFNGGEFVDTFVLGRLNHTITG